MHGPLHPQSREPHTRVVGLRDTGETDADRRLRASDDDRRRVTDLLQAHYVAGRLVQTEFEGRLQEAVAARTLGDLDALLTDLPALGASGADAESQQDHPSRRERRQRRKHVAGHCGEQSFRGHATSYLLVMGLLVAIWALTSPGGYFWPVWPMLGWGIGLVAHGLTARNKTEQPDEHGSGHWSAHGTH
jgi:hypothetical protein